MKEKKATIKNQLFTISENSRNSANIQMIIHATYKSFRYISCLPSFDFLRDFLDFDITVDTITPSTSNHPHRILHAVGRTAGDFATGIAVTESQGSGSAQASPTVQDREAAFAVAFEQGNGRGDTGAAFLCPNSERTVCRTPGDGKARGIAGSSVRPWHHCQCVDIQHETERQHHC